MTALQPPTVAEVHAAAKRVKGVVVRTPLLESPLLNRQLGARFLFKAEPLQRTGSFKLRGATNFVAAMTPEERARGIVAYSSGNHAQAVAAAAHAAGVSAKIVMPTDAPRIKLESTRAWGATIVTYDRLTGDRQAIAEGIAKAEGRVIAPPFDHPLIIAGQGTAGLEIVEDLQALTVAPDIVAAPCGGGGLVSGVALAIKETFPEAAIHAVEPEANDDTARSWATGERQRADLTRPTICDSLQTSMPGMLTLTINWRLLAGVATVSDSDVRAAVRLAFEFLKLVVEPGGAVGFAAALSGRFPTASKTVVVLLSGGNVDAERFADCLRP
ncbi:MAG: threonine/serine dehydratase [Alphaproteobacteria bacterium]|nr:threonine/serine dehydratase [Alphaproteobacteria bacterium]